MVKRSDSMHTIHRSGDCLSIFHEHQHPRMSDEVYLRDCLLLSVSMRPCLVFQPVHLLQFVGIEASMDVNIIWVLIIMRMCEIVLVSSCVCVCLLVSSCMYGV